VGHRPSRRRTEALPVIALFVLLGATARAIELHLPGIEAASLHGYYKNFFLALDSSDPQIEGGQEDLNRGRLMLEGQFTKNVDFAVHYEHLLTINPLNDTGIFLGPASRGRQPGIWPLNWSLATCGSVSWRHDIDRLFVRRRAEWGDVTVGRQAIGWGAGLIWSPEDLFVAFSPVDIDREFRTGVDAARVLASFGQFTEAEAVYAVFGDGQDNQASAVRWRTTLAGPGVDIGLMAGKFYQDAVGGGLVSGEVHGVGVHGEATVTHDFEGGHTRVGAQDFARAVAGADYRFPGEVRVVGEYYFNGFGTSDPSHYLDLAASPRLTRGEIYNLGRQYLGFIADWQAHPLLHLGAQGEWNLQDPSAFVGPTFALSLSDNAELDGGAYFSLGAERKPDLTLGSEFGSAPNTFYAAAKVYF
jgi:hypothetical protein